MSTSTVQPRYASIGEVAFSTGELIAVAHAIGTTASALTHEAETRFSEAAEESQSALAGSGIEKALEESK
ncbi:hypothetical protein [Schaalia sp. lx-260]|uniref:hypothetical protein n=1 Tax=Schaalia sp. lx-260 TaxID=2899082 RepID=UPI001E5DD2D1|nr:hypothetical protein [Schaalia sp. lx-260]MCD4549701.1 hypothetical protein [Schaalia sp. lx-260]